jgi:hypothetical protein
MAIDIQSIFLHLSAAGGSEFLGMLPVALDIASVYQGEPHFRSTIMEPGCKPGQGALFQPEHQEGFSQMGFFRSPFSW